MRIARFALGERILFGQVEEHAGGAAVVRLDGDVLGGQARANDNERYRLQDVSLLWPVQPSKIVAIGRNYAEHAAELAHEVAERPRIFIKPPSSLIGPGQAIHFPPQSQDVQYEAELAVVIGRICRNVRADDALDYVCGFTCANDVTARDIQRVEGLPTYAKSFDTFCPLGPWIETELNAADVRVTCAVNGELRQDGRTRDMLWNVPALIGHISAAMTLLPGDVLLTGTPAGVGPMEPGDEVAVTIEGIGTLTNPTIAADQA